MLKAVLSRATARVAVVGGRTSCCPTVGAPAVCVRGFSSAQSNVDKKLRIQQEREIFFKEVIREKERALDAGELRPLMAENPIELLQMADEAIPEGTGYRGNKRKKQQRIRWTIIRKAHTIQREQRMAKHERDMEKRKGSVIRARMEALGIPLPPAAPATAST